jgi:hypothetical protein
MPDNMIDVTVTVQDVRPDRAPLTRDDIPPPPFLALEVVKGARNEWRREVHALLVPEVLLVAYDALVRLSDSKRCSATPESIRAVERAALRVIDTLGLADVFTVFVEFDPLSRALNCAIGLTEAERDTYGPLPYESSNGRDPFTQEMQGEWHD